MDFRRLRYFLAVAQQLSFRRAAELLNTSQPSLSQQIRALEEELGVELFDRSKRQVRLTVAGAEYYAGVSNLLSEFDWCAQNARDAQAGKRGGLSIGVNGMVMFEHLPQVVRRFRQKLPEVRLNVTVLRNPGPLRTLQARRIDVALTAETLPDPEIERREVWRIPWCVALPSDHPAASEEAVRLSELTGATLLMPPHRHAQSGHEEILAVCRSQGFVPGAIQEVVDVAAVEMLVGLVISGLGIAILPATYARIVPDSMVFKPLAGLESESRISVCWRQDDRSALVREFVEVAAASGNAG